MAAEHHNDTFRDKTLRLRIEADHEGKLQPLQERACSYARPPLTCEGPGGKNPCRYCRLEREERLRLHPEEDVPGPGVPTVFSSADKPVPSIDLHASLCECDSRQSESPRPKDLHFSNPAAAPPEKPFTRVKLDNSVNPVIPKPHPPSTHPGGRGVPAERKATRTRSRVGATAMRARRTSRSSPDTTPISSGDRRPHRRR
jgi:hypothetical protein